MGAGWPNGQHVGDAGGDGPARCGDHSGDEGTWKCTWASCLCQFPGLDAASSCCRMVPSEGTG